MSAFWVPPRRATFGWRNRIRSATLTGAGWIDLEALKTVELEHSAAAAGLGQSDLVLTARWSNPPMGARRLGDQPQRLGTGQGQAARLVW